MASFYFNHRRILTTVSLDQDELWSWMLVSKRWTEVFNGILGDTQGFLYYFISKIWLLITPVANDYWVRFPALIFSCLSVGIIFLILNKAFNLNLAIVGSFLFSHLPVFSYYSAYHTPYSLLVFLGSVNLFAIQKLISDPNKNRYQFLFMLSLCLLPATHHLGILYLVSIVLSVYYLKIPVCLTWLWKTLIFFLSSLYLMQLYIQFQQSLSLISWVEKFEINPIAIVKSLLGNYPEDTGILIVSCLGLIFFLKELLKKNINPENPVDRFVFLNFLIISLVVVQMILFSYFITSLKIHRYFVFLTPFIVTLIVYGIDTLLKGNFNKIVIIAFLIFNLNQASYSGNYQIRENVKGFFNQLKTKKLIPANSSVVCLYDKVYVGMLAPYSKMHFSKDICTQHIGMERLSEANPRADYIIYSKHNSIEHSYSPANRDPIYSFDNFTIYH